MNFLEIITNQVMRVTGGQFKGHPLPMKFASHVRPSTDKMRESMFNMLANQLYFEELSVLDLFSGSGIIALEFLSRGAKEVVSVDLDGKNIQHQKKIREEKHCQQWEIVKADVFKYLQNSPKKYDLIFADPPYAMPNLQNLVSMVRPHLIDGGIFLFEHQPRLVFDPPPTREKDYGSSKLSIFE